MIVNQDATHVVLQVPDAETEKYREVVVPLAEVSAFNRETKGQAQIFFVVWATGERWPAKARRDVSPLGPIDPLNAEHGDHILRPWREVREIWAGDNPSVLVWTADGPGPDGRVYENDDRTDPDYWS
jgi:hypothetical protein